MAVRRRCNLDAILAFGTNGVGTLTFSDVLTLDAASTNNFVVTTVGGASNKVAVAGALTPNGSVIRITSGTALWPGTNNAVHLQRRHQRDIHCDAGV